VIIINRDEGERPRRTMGLLANLVLVFVAGLVTALATGLGALPFFVIEDVSDRLQVALWGLASGIMVSASTFGLLFEGVGAAGGDLIALLRFAPDGNRFPRAAPTVGHE